MGDPLRICRPLSELTGSKQLIEFKDKISGFKELAEIVAADLAALNAQDRPANWNESAVSGWLQFDQAGAGMDVPAVAGRAETCIDAVCQRCLGPLKMRLETAFQLQFGAAAAGDDAYEHWELDDENVCPIDIVEEQLILTIPIVMRHGTEQECLTFLPELSSLVELTTGNATNSDDRVRPFATLRSTLEEHESGPGDTDGSTKEP